MGLAHGLTRLHAEFVGEPGAQIAVDDEGLCLTAGAVQGEHQLAVVGLPQRMLRGQGGQLGHEVGQAFVAQGEFGVVAPLVEQQSRLLQAAHEGVPAHLGGRPAQRHPPPQSERGPALAAHPLPVALGTGGTGGGDMGVEDLDVEFAVVDTEDVPRGRGEEPSGLAEEAAQPGDVVVQRGQRGDGRRPAPQGVLQRLDGDDPPGVEQQDGQEGTEFGAGDGDDGGAVAGAGAVPMG